MPFHGLQGRRHWAVYWARIGTDRTGQPTTTNVAAEIRCRWDDTVRTVLGPDGNPLAIDATVGGLDRAIPVGSLMWKGRLEDMPGTSQTPAQDVMRVVSYEETPDIRGRNAYREVRLSRTKDVLGQTG